MIHRIGNVYHVTDDDIDSSYCVLVQIEANRVILICLQDHANRWAKYVNVKRTKEISQEEFEKMSHAGNFRYVGRLEDVIKIHDPKYIS